ncbi:recombination mediator RecR, partial [Escherichia coli]
MKTPSSLTLLTESLRRLPGIGPKTAQRMAFHLLQHDRDAAVGLSQSLTKALETIRHCALCNTFTEQVVCETCQDSQRDHTQLC